MSTLNPNVTRWAHLLDQEALQAGLDPREITPLALAIVSKESQGRPDARNKGSNAVGLGQQFAWYKKGHPRAGERYFGAGPKGGPFTPPWTSREAEFMPGLPVTWDPHDQVRAIIRGLAHYLKSASRTNGDLDSAQLAYAAGGGGLRDFISGDDTGHAARFVANYVPDLIQRHQTYSAWYVGWANAGRPTTTATVASGEGTRFTVTVAKHDVPRGEPLDSPFDGNFQWSGKSRKAGPVGPDGEDPDDLPPPKGQASRSNDGAKVGLGVLVGALLGYLFITLTSEA